jgi:hypothetical protein
MAAVTKTTLYSVPQDVVYEIVNDRSNIPDPRSPTSNRPFVYKGVDPWESNFDFSQVPYIVCRMPRLNLSNRSANARTKKASWVQDIVIRTLKTGSGMNRSDAGYSDMGKIVNSLLMTFNSVQARSGMNTNKLAFADIDMTQEPIEILIDNQVVLESIFTITYSVRMQVY